MMKNPSLQQSRVDEQLRQETQQRKPHQHSPDDPSAGPVIMKDCLGRKFLFPIQICRSWQVRLFDQELYESKANPVTRRQNMENLIRRSFSHIETLNSKIFRGSYDTLSPTGEIVLPEIWNTVIKPGWVVELSLWDYIQAGETNQKDPNNGLNKMGSGVQSTAGNAKVPNFETSSDVQLPTGKRRTSLEKWLGSRISTPNAIVE